MKAHNAGAVVTVPILGAPNKIDQLLELKRRFDFVLMEDACAATGSRYDGQLMGAFGEMSTFSFFFGHHLSTIEGGMVCTNDEELNDILLQIRSHGWAKDLTPEKEEEQARNDGVIQFSRRFTFYHPNGPTIAATAYELVRGASIPKERLDLQEIEFMGPF